MGGSGGGYVGWWGPEGVGPEGWGAHSLPPEISFFLLSGGSSRGILVVFEAPGPSTCDTMSSWESTDCPVTGRPVVDGDQEFLLPVGQSESPWRNPPRVEVKVGINTVVCSGKGSGHFVARVAGARGGDGETPTATDVEQESKCAGLRWGRQGCSRDSAVFSSH